jgi:hypothetical protein
VNVTITTTLPTFTGGVVQSGTYVLESEQLYISGFPGGSGQTVEMVEDTIQVSGNAIQRATNTSSSSTGASVTPAGTFTATFSTGGSTFRGTQSCPSFQTISGSYSATPTTLTLETRVVTDAGIAGYVIGTYSLQ